MNTSDAEPQPTPEDLAAEYLARREDGEELDLADFLARLATEAERAALKEMVGDVLRASRALPHAPTPGALFHGRYEIVRQIGEGGMGRVYYARDKELGRAVALKVMNTLGREAGDRAQLLLKESRLLAALRHPNIVAVHDSGLEGELAWLVMDYVDGRALSDVLERMRAEVERSASGRIAQRDGAQWVRALDRPDAPGRTSLIDEKDWYRTCARIACEIARTLEAAHGQGVLHRDLKPANVMLTAGGHPVVLDFGLGGSADVKVGDVTQGLYGSVPYMAPEQVRSEKVGLDPRTDVYQLGLLLYEMLALRRAFTGTAMGEILERVKHGLFDRPSRHNPGIPRELEAICMLALEHAPERRYPSARALREDLEAYLGGNTMPVALRGDRARAVVRRARALGRRHPVLIAAAAVAVVGIATWAAFSGAPSFALLEPFQLARDGTLRELSDGDSVVPDQFLGVRVRSTRPLVLYAFSMFDAPDGETRLDPMNLVPAEEITAPRLSKAYGLSVSPCQDPGGTSCPRLVCSKVEKENRAEGLLVLASQGPRPDFEDWMQRIRSEGGSGVTKAEALALFPATSVSRGGSVTDVRFTEAERRTFVEGLARSLARADSEFAFPGVESLAVMCRVVAP